MFWVLFEFVLRRFVFEFEFIFDIISGWLSICRGQASHWSAQRSTRWQWFQRPAPGVGTCWTSVLWWTHVLCLASCDLCPPRPHLLLRQAQPLPLLSKKTTTTHLTSCLERLPPFFKTGNLTLKIPKKINKPLQMISQNLSELLRPLPLCPLPLYLCTIVPLPPSSRKINLRVSSLCLNCATKTCLFGQFCRCLAS